MKLKKLMVFLSLVSCLIALNFKSAFAYNNEVPIIVVEHITNLYENNKNYDVIDENNVSIRDRFIEENIVNYENGNFENIYSNILDNNLVLVISSEKNISTRASTTKNLTKVFIHNIKFNPIKAVTIAVECYATIRVNESTGEITSFSGPTVSLKDPVGGGAVVEKLYDVNTSYKWGSSAHRSIDFTYKYGYERIEAGEYGTATTYRSEYFTRIIHGE